MAWDPGGRLKSTRTTMEKVLYRDRKLSELTRKLINGEKEKKMEKERFCMK